jgi:type IV fimbrial biogenesis protein FimT
MSGGKGFTLLELAVVMAIVAILLVAATPPMQGLLLDARRTRVINELVRALHAARAESIRSSSDVVVCPSDTGEQCSEAGDSWRQGWMVFVNTNRDEPPVRDIDERLVLRYGTDRTGTVSANRNSFVYRPFGRRSTNGTLIYCDRRGPSAARAVIVSHTGRPRIARESPSGAPLVCPE